MIPIMIMCFFFFFIITAPPLPVSVWQRGSPIPLGHCLQSLFLNAITWPPWELLWISHLECCPYQQIHIHTYIHVHKQTQASSTEWLALTFTAEWQRLWQCCALVAESANTWLTEQRAPHAAQVLLNSHVGHKCCQLKFPCSVSSIKLTCHVACGMHSFHRAFYLLKDAVTCNLKQPSAGCHYAGCC